MKSGVELAKASEVEPEEQIELLVDQLIFDEVDTIHCSVGEKCDTVSMEENACCHVITQEQLPGKCKLWMVHSMPSDVDHFSNEHKQQRQSSS